MPIPGTGPGNDRPLDDPPSEAADLVRFKPPKGPALVAVRTLMVSSGTGDGPHPLLGLSCCWVTCGLPSHSGVCDRPIQYLRTRFRFEWFRVIGTPKFFSPWERRNRLSSSYILYTHATPLHFPLSHHLFASLQLCFFEGIVLFLLVVFSAPIE